MFRMTTEEKAQKVYVPEWLREHSEHEHSVKWPEDGWSVYAECFDCGPDSAMTITLMNEAHARAVGILEERKAVTFGG